MAKMKLVTDDLDKLADAIATRMARLILDGYSYRNDPTRGTCPNCGKRGFIDYCFDCKFVPWWERKEGDRPARQTNFVTADVVQPVRDEAWGQSDGPTEATPDEC